MSKKDLPNIKDVSRIPDELVPVIQWWNRNGRMTSWIVAGIVAVGALLYWWSDTSANNKDIASIGFATASSTEEFKANQELGEDTAPAAAIALARIYNNNGDYASALALVDTLDVEEAALKDACAMNKALALEGLGRYDDALKTLEGVSAGFLKVDATYAKARCLAQKGDKAAALALLASLPESDNKLLVTNMVEACGAPLCEPAPVVETPVVEAPVEAPTAEAPVVEGPVEVPAVETPVEAPVAEPTPAEVPAAQ